MPNLLGRSTWVLHLGCQSNITRENAHNACKSSDSCNIGETGEFEHQNNATIKICVDSSAKKDNIKLTQSMAANTIFPLWGRVVDHTLAANMPRAMTMPLKVAEVPSEEECKEDRGGRTFYLDGSIRSNTRKTDCCIGWLMRVAPPAKDRLAQNINKL